MKTLIWKELRENLKWTPLPGLVVLLVFLLDKPDEAMPDVTGALFYCLTAVGFGAALGFVQVFFEGHGDKRSLLMHRPLSPSRIFLAKVLAGIGLYLLALGVPFVCLESWLATPGSIPAPFHWRTSLPWLANILSGLVYYFAGMLVAQRDVRWFASRCLPLGTAFCCSYLVWIVSEFWQALVTIGIFALFVGVAAWGSFRAGGAYKSQPRRAKIALAVTFLLGMLIMSVLGKQGIGQECDSGIEWECNIDRKGRMLLAPFKPSIGDIGPWTDLKGEKPPDLKGKVVDSTIRAPWSASETPLAWSYRNSGRFYVECKNASTPGQERWYYDRARGRVFGYDTLFHQCLGSFGPDGFASPDRQPEERFQGELRYRAGRWRANDVGFLVFPGRVYTLDFARRTIRTIFTPGEGETITFASRWSDPLDRKRERIVVSTDKSFHNLTAEGSPVVSLPRVYNAKKYLSVFVGRLENPERYFVWYQSWLPFTTFLEPEEFKTLPNYLLEYDTTGREVAGQTIAPFPPFAASYGEALFGLVTPIAEGAILIGATRSLRSEARSRGSIHKPLLLDYLENSKYYIPATSGIKETPRGLVPGYLALIVLSAAASAIGCFRLARRHACARARCLGWALGGFFFGWVGLLLLLALKEWPARIPCPKCGKLRVVTRDTCEHCGALHAAPVLDGTEIFEPILAGAQVTLAAS